MHDHGRITDDESGHMHGHHSHAEAPQWFLKLGVALEFSFFVAALAAWYISGSVAILGDSFHNLFHALIYIIALWGNVPARRLRQARASFLMGVIIIGTAIFIAAIGGYRIYRPEEVLGKYSIIVASLDVVSDFLLLGIIFKLTYNTIRIYKIFLIRVVLRDIVIDNLASLGVIASGAIILIYQFYRADGIAAIPIAFIALLLGIKTIRESRREVKMSDQEHILAHKK